MKYQVIDDERNFRSLVVAPDGSTIARCNSAENARKIVYALNSLILWVMEIRLYRSHELMAQGKHFLCVRVENPDAFEFDKTLNVFRTLYGSDIIFVVIAL